MIQIIGSLIFTLVFGWLLFNGFFMLLWPSRWTRLPEYIVGPFQGANHALRDTRNGRLQIRFVGFVLLTLIGISVFLSLSRVTLLLWDRLPSPPNEVLLAFVCLGMGRFGLYFLLRPESALRLTFPNPPPGFNVSGKTKAERILILFIRASGALFSLGAIYLAWTSLRGH